MYSTVLCKKFVSTSIIQELSRSRNVVMIGVLSKNTIRLGCAKLFSHNTNVQLNRPLFLQTKSKTSIGSITFSSDRYYCKNYSPFPKVPEFPPVIWPNMFKSIKALLFSYLIIKPQYDSEFSLQDFAKNSKKAVVIVSNYIAKRDFSNLEGLVTGDVLEQVKSIISKINDEEIKDMGFNDDDIYLFLPVQLDIINDIKLKDRRFVEITMCYHAIHNLEEIKKRSNEIIDIQNELKSSIYVLNYRFIREYTEGVKDTWTVNAINHLKAEEHDKTVF